MDALKLYGAVTNGVTAALKWRQNFMQEFGASLQEKKARAMFLNLPPQMKDAMRKADPQGYEELLNKLQAKGE